MKTKATGTRKSPEPQARVVDRCELFATFVMVCPLCGTTVPPKTAHSCKRLEEK